MIQIGLALNDLKDTDDNFNFPDEIIYEELSLSTNIYKSLSNSEHLSYIIKVNGDTIDDIRKAKCINTVKIDDYFNKPWWYKV